MWTLLLVLAFDEPAPARFTDVVAGAYESRAACTAELERWLFDLPPRDNVVPKGWYVLVGECQADATIS